MRSALIFIATLALVFVAGAFTENRAFADGKLDKFRKSATGEDEETQSGQPIDKSESPRVERAARDKEITEDMGHKNSVADDDAEGIVGMFLRGIFGSLFETVGSAIIEDHGVRYRAYPYAKEFYTFFDPDRPPRGAPGVLKMEYQRVSNRVHSLTWRLTLRMSSGFDLSITDSHYFERLHGGRLDWMAFTKVRLNYSFSPLPGNVLIRAGVGGAGLGSYAGIDAGLEVDWFFHPPFAFHVGVSHTTMRYGNGITDIDTAFGVMAGPVEFSIGYRGLISGHEEINGAYVSFGFWF
jgi:hypothetical protein